MLAALLTTNLEILGIYLYIYINSIYVCSNGHTYTHTLQRAHSPVCGRLYHLDLYKYSIFCFYKGK